MKYIASDKKLFRFEILILGATLLAASILAFGSFRAIQRSAVWVDDAFRVRDTLSGLQMALQDLETTQRTYLASGQPSDLSLYYGANRLITADVVRLQFLTQDHPRQQELIAQLRPLLNEHMAYYGNAVLLKQSKEGKLNSPNEHVGPGRIRRDEIRHVLETMRQETANQLAERLHDASKNVAWARRVLAFLLLAGAVGLVVIGFLLKRLRKLEKMVTVCAWSKTIRHEGEWISFEEYLRRIYGVTVSHGMSDTEFAKRRADIGKEG